MRFVENEDNFVATFTGQKVAASDTTGFYISVYDEPGEVGGQLGAKFLDGKQIAYFVAVPLDEGQVNLQGDVEVSGDTISMTFPRTAGGLDGLSVGKWSATYSLAGQDVGMCPGDYGTQPFPG